MTRLAAFALALACSHAPDAPTGPTIEILVDGEALTSAAINEPVALSRLLPYLPPPLWLLVTGQTADHRFVEISSPSITYPDAEVRIYLERGQPTIGVFRRVAPNLPEAVARIAAQPVIVLGPITRIEIATRQTAAPGFELVVDGEPVALTEVRDQLGTQRGASFRQLIGDKPHTRVRLIGTDEQTVPWADVLSHDARLKQTHQGAYVFRLWDGDRAVIEQRDLVKIVVE